MFSDNNPPIPTTQDEFPSFNSVVNVSNCWYYLSLLERFVNITSSLSQDDLKVYLVRAEYRYFKWMFTNIKDRKVALSIPPVDVAFFWQAHMLSPLRFQEDTTRLAPFTSVKIPLKEIHEMHKNTNSPVRENWGRLMRGEPYELTKKDLFKKNGYANVTCIVCNSRIQSSWKDYAEWRTDHTIALQCHCCDAMFTVKHVGKANLFLDNVKPYKIAGLTVNAEGIPFKASMPKILLNPTQDIKSLPFNEGLKPLDEYFEKKLKVSTPSNTMIRKKMIDAIQSTYLCTPYRGSSIDLIQAVARQYKFAVKATKRINWDAPQGIIRGIRHYASFLAVIKENKGLTAVPTYEIDLAWHTHMLHHGNYSMFCSRFTGKIINHDDTIPEKELESYVKKTDMAWHDRNERRKMAHSTDVAPVSKPVMQKSGIKNKLKLILSTSRSKTDISPENIRNQLAHKNKYIDEKALFGDRYTVGTYRTTPPYKRSATVSTGSEKSDVNINIADYDTEKISFHDKRDIQEFITLKNSDQLMDEKFKDVKKSVYGFIGTSTCGNTDYLNRWSPKEKNKDDTKHNDSFLESGYTKEKPMFDFKNGTLKPNRKRYKNFQNNEATRYHTQNDTFNWYLVSLAWSDSHVPNCDNNKSSCGGWGGSPDTGGAACNNTSSSGVFRSSTEYGGGSASCGGGSSSCGSSCGGSGCGGGCGGS
ncbi:hypothetical protein INT48_000843 [Thamnidium elegans]|uniref:Uncharacterized protein n=1 Tax=Thamnidium elegans TaxID=101142 RepID=A0A8H7W1J7_9FUNG|nr:hypothetical protein INT48_000843 [Thamnidium elegans]